MTETTLPAGWPAMSIADAHAALTAPGMPGEMEEVVILGVKTRVWKNLPPSLRSVVEAGRAHGEKVFLVYEDERVTFEAFHRAVAPRDRQRRPRAPPPSPGRPHPRAPPPRPPGARAGAGRFADTAGDRPGAGGGTCALCAPGLPPDRAFWRISSGPAQPVL